MDKYLIVGLGNVGKEYKNTPHNAGFMFIDNILNELNISQLSFDKRFNAEINQTNLNTSRIIIAKPQTNMNLSGDSVLLIVNYYNINLNNLYIIHDDLDIMLGKYKLQQGKGPRVHNGINSVEKSLHSNEFWRIRIGIENRSPQERKLLRGKIFVLKSLTKEESTILNQTITSSINSLLKIISSKK